MRAALLAVFAQATPEGVAERDARELAQMLAGRWNNAEAVHFARELGEAPPERLDLLIEAEDGGDGFAFRAVRDGGAGAAYRFRVAPSEGASRTDPEDCLMRPTRRGDAFSAPIRGAACAGPLVGTMTLTEDALAFGDRDAPLRRADPYTCWVSRKKDAEGWTWTPGLTLHEGEYVQLPDDPAVARPAGIKLRHVRWPYGRNRDSLVLYVHEAEDEAAVSYAWTAPDGARIAVNLRWIQASCTRDGE